MSKIKNWKKTKAVAPTKDGRKLGPRGQYARWESETQDGTKVELVKNGEGYTVEVTAPVADSEEGYPSPFTVPYAHANNKDEVKSIAVEFMRNNEDGEYEVKPSRYETGF